MRLRRNWSPGREGGAGDYVWVNPYEWRVVPAAVAKEARAQRYGDNTPFPRARGMSARRHVEEAPLTFRRDPGPGVHLASVASLGDRASEGRIDDTDSVQGRGRREAHAGSEKASAERGHTDRPMSPSACDEDVISKAPEAEVVVLSDTESGSPIEVPSSFLFDRGLPRRSRRNYYGESPSPEFSGYRPCPAGKSAPGPRQARCEESAAVAGPAVDPSTSRGSSPSLSFNFTAASPSRPAGAIPSPDWSHRPPSSSPKSPPNNPAPGPLSRYLDCSDFPSTPGTFRSPTPPFPYTRGAQADPASGTPYLQDDGEASVPAAVPASPVQECGAPPTVTETVPGPESVV